MSIEKEAIVALIDSALDVEKERSRWEADMASLNSESINLETQLEAIGAQLSALMKSVRAGKSVAVFDVIDLFDRNQRLMNERGEQKALLASLKVRDEYITKIARLRDRLLAVRQK